LSFKLAKRFIDPKTEVWTEIECPFGWLSLCAHGDRLREIAFGKKVTGSEKSDDHPIFKETLRQLQTYFSDPSTTFSLPLELTGTEFCRRVWQSLTDIPLGQTRSYGELARALDTGPRAVAAGCRSNHWPIIIPCHRVVAIRNLGGYCGQLSGPLIEIKRWLLKHEGCAID
jgi:methylated-DNA-[protein]-cysteine S-methyltransferase